MLSFCDAVPLKSLAPPSVEHAHWGLATSPQWKTTTIRTTGLETEMAPWKRNTTTKYAELIPVLLLLFYQKFYMSTLSSRWTWPVWAGMLAEASFSSPTLTRTTRKAGPGRESGDAVACVGGLFRLAVVSSVRTWHGLGDKCSSEKFRAKLLPVKLNKADRRVAKQIIHKWFIFTRD